jgi:hypothetical protein
LHHHVIPLHLRRACAFTSGAKQSIVERGCMDRFAALAMTSALPFAQPSSW